MVGDLNNYIGIDYSQKKEKSSLLLSGKLNCFNIPKVYDFLKENKLLSKRTRGYKDGLLSTTRKYCQYHFCKKEDIYSGLLEFDLTNVNLEDLSPVALTIEIARSIGRKNLKVLVDKSNVEPFKLASIDKILNVEII